MRRSRGLALLVLLLSGCSGLSKLDYTSLGRDSWQRPRDVVRALGLAPGDHVADLGAGDGYFVPYLAEAVGADGRVYAVEVDDSAIAGLKERFGNGAAPNVEVILGDYDDPELPDGAVDLVLLVNTYHHIEDRPGYFARLRADLSPAGRVAVIDPNADLTGVLSLFLDAGHQSRASDVAREMEEAGYRPAETFDFLPVQIFEVFEPTPDG